MWTGFFFFPLFWSAGITRISSPGRVFLSHVHHSVQWRGRTLCIVHTSVHLPPRVLLASPLTSVSHKNDVFHTRYSHFTRGSLFQSFHASYFFLLGDFFFLIVFSSKQSPKAPKSRGDVYRLFMFYFKVVRLFISLLFCYCLLSFFSLDVLSGCDWKIFLSVTMSDDISGINSWGRRRKLSITAPKALRRYHMTNTVYLTPTLDYMWITACFHPIGQCHGSHSLITRDVTLHRKYKKIPTR